MGALLFSQKFIFRKNLFEKCGVPLEVLHIFQTDFPHGTKFRILLCHYTDSNVSRPYFVRNGLTREGKAWEPGTL